VCVGALDLTIASDDPSSSALCVMCVRRFPKGVLGGGQVCPPLVTHSVRGNAPKKKIGRFLLFLADFAIFSGLLN
jgi:hypothetical protein